MIRALQGNSRPRSRNTPDEEVPPGYLVPIAYLWTRTVTCKNPTCKATVPLLRQTWLCKKKDRHVALKVVAPKGAKRVRFEIVESETEKGLGLDPAGFSKGGNATCPFCGTVANIEYVKEEGRAGRMASQAMAVVCTRHHAHGKVYFSADGIAKELLPANDYRLRIEQKFPDRMQCFDFGAVSEKSVDLLLDKWSDREC